MIVRRVCAWCGTTIGLIASPDMTKPTHGGCKPCMTTWRAEWFERYPK